MAHGHVSRRVCHVNKVLKTHRLDTWPCARPCVHSISVHTGWVHGRVPDCVYILFCDIQACARLCGHSVLQL